MAEAAVIASITTLHRAFITITDIMVGMAVGTMATDTMGGTVIIGSAYSAGTMARRLS